MNLAPVVLVMFEPENDLERSLMKAAGDPSHRPQFYRDLLESVIYFIQAGDRSLDIQDGVLQEGAQIQIQPWQRNGEDWIPIFSSLTRLQQSLKTGSTYLRLNARSFLEITHGANVILNPGLEYGKEFTPSEIESMLNGSIFRANQGYTVPEQTKVVIGQPKEYPTELVGTLARLFRKHSSIRAAYLAHFFNPERDEQPHTLIGIDAEGDWESIVGEAGMVATEVMPKSTIVDFVRVSPDDTGVSQYMLQETKPFYKRSFLKGLFR